MATDDMTLRRWLLEHQLEANRQQDQERARWEKIRERYDHDEEDTCYGPEDEES